MGSPRERAALFVALTIGLAALTMGPCAACSEAAGVNIKHATIKVIKLRHRKVRIAILGAEAFDPRSIREKGLVFGFDKQGRDGGFVEARRLSGLKDMNGDGRKDRIAVFKLSEADAEALRNGEAKQVEVQGIYKEGIFRELFVARALVGDSDDPTSDCASVQNNEGALVGERCIWITADNASFKPIDVQTLVNNLNAGLTTTDLEIGPAAVIEAYGGGGAQGAPEKAACDSKGGAGGAGGYARTILTVSGLPQSIWMFTGESGEVSGNRAGGAGTVVSSIDLADLTSDQLASTNVDDIVNLGILALAGGGGGGGNGHISGGTECHHGGAGGQGGIAVADTTGNASGTGSDGEKGNPGGGGSCAAAGAGGGEAGSVGIGGPGGQAATSGGSGQGGGPLWAGWSSADNPILTPTAWAFGAGGFNGNEGGRGGGGCGGGASAKGNGDAHKGGGGGGGSVATKATVSSDSIPADLFYGQPNSSNGFASQVVVTFQLQMKTNVAGGRNLPVTPISASKR